MNIRHVTYCILLMSVIVLAGCARKTTVVLLPNDDGKVGKVSVATDTGSVDITKPRQATVVTGRNSQPEQPRAVSEEEIEKDFGEALDSLPTPPVHFILYFKSDSEKLTADSTEMLAEVLAAIDERDSQDISVVGHTDTAGDRNYNLKLSRRRAAAVTEILIEQGVRKSHIRSTSHGEQNPLVKTADNVSEPRNRRVEVVVR